MKRFIVMLMAALIFAQPVFAAPKYTILIPPKENQWITKDPDTGELLYSLGTEPRKEVPYAEFAAAGNAFPAWYADWDGVTCNGADDRRIGEKSGKNFLLDASGNILGAPWDDINYCEYGGYYITLAGKKGYMDMNGNVVVKPEYSELYRVENGFYEARISGEYDGNADTTDWRCGLLGPGGQILVPLEYDSLYEIGHSDRFTSVKCGSYSDNSDSPVIKTFDSEGREVEREGSVVEQMGDYVLFLASERDADGFDLFGLEDAEGKVIVKPQYNDIKILESGLILGGLKKNIRSGYEVMSTFYGLSYDYYLLDPAGLNAPVIQPFTRFIGLGEPDGYGNYILGKDAKDENLGTIQYGYFTADLKPVIPMTFDVLGPFQDGYSIAAVNAEYSWGGRGEIYMQNAQYGLLNMSGKWILAPKYQALEYAGHGLYNAMEGGKQFVVDAAGARKGPSNLTDFDGYVGVETGEDYKYRIVDEKGTNLAGVEWSYMTSLGDGMFTGGVVDDSKAVLPNELIKLDPGIVDAMPITRRDFAEMAVNLICGKRSMTVDELLAEHGVTPDKSPFNDSADPYVLAADALDILGATSYHMFTPEGKLSREYASALAVKIGQALDVSVTWDAGANPKAGLTRADAEAMMKTIGGAVK